jgi:hypothetical protein
MFHSHTCHATPLTSTSIAQLSKKYYFKIKNLSARATSNQQLAVVKNYCEFTVGIISNRCRTLKQWLATWRLKNDTGRLLSMKVQSRWSNIAAQRPLVH